MATRREFLDSMKGAVHKSVEAHRERGAASAARKKELDSARRKKNWANRSDDAAIAAYLARNPVALCDREADETVNTFGEEE